VSAAEAALAGDGDRGRAGERLRQAAAVAHRAGIASEGS